VTQPSVSRVPTAAYYPTLWEYETVWRRLSKADSSRMCGAMTIILYVDLGLLGLDFLPRITEEFDAAASPK